MKLSMVTSSEKKIAEIERTLGSSYQLKQLDHELPEIQSRDVEEVVGAKLEAARQIFPLQKLFVEDTSFTIDAMGKQFPGALIKHILEAQESSQKIYEMARGVQRLGVLAAKASVCIGYTDGRETTQLFMGEINGRLAPKRSEGWGFDEIFIPEGYGEQRLCELDPDHKATMNHRALAVLKLKAYLETDYTKFI